ncbi:hypothetical protein H9P43_001452 [Blastocladiella emersonii ATCC 22665]|nr:hypothetical protein H9P43_001452 [Blastocladiella emersonii ATCC 22665]
MAVKFTADLSTAKDFIFLCGLCLQFLSFVALLYNLSVVFPQWKKNRSTFWHASLIGSLLLLPVPLFEISFVLSRFTSGTLWPFPSYLTIIGDVFVRTGYGIITVCRFHRLRIVSPLRRKTSTRVFYVAATLIFCVAAACIYSSFALRLAELPLKLGQAPPQHVLALREQDRLINFIAFSCSTLASLATDFLFYNVIVASTLSVQDRSAISLRVKLEIIGPYLPAIVTGFVYITCLLLSFFAPSIPSMQFSSNTLGKLIPAIDSVIFYRFSIQQTKTLLKSLSSGSGSATRSYGASSIPLSKVRGGHLTSSTPYTTTSSVPMPTYAPSSTAPYVPDHKAAYPAVGPPPVSTNSIRNEPYRLSPAGGPGQYPQHQQPQAPPGARYASAPSPQPATRSAHRPHPQQQQQQQQQQPYSAPASRGRSLQASQNRDDVYESFPRSRGF